MRQLISDGKIFGTVDQDPYPQAYNAMKMAWLHFNGKDADIPKPSIPSSAADHEGKRGEDASSLGVFGLSVLASARNTVHRRVHKVP